MKNLVLLVMCLFPSTALCCAAYLIAHGCPWWGAAFLAVAIVTAPRYGR